MSGDRSGHRFRRLKPASGGDAHVAVWGVYSRDFLTLRKECEVCHLDYSFADPADGPRSLLRDLLWLRAERCAGSLAEVEFDAPYWVHLVVTLPFTLLTCIPLLRPLKCWLVASQYFYKAEEGRLVTPMAEAARNPESKAASNQDAAGQIPRMHAGSTNLLP